MLDRPSVIDKSKDKQSEISDTVAYGNNIVNVNEKQIKSYFNSKPKVLFVKDSVSQVTSARQLETATAFTSKFDRLSRVPEKNFNDVVKNQLENPGREPIEHLVLSAPTDDISILNASHLDRNDPIDQLVNAVKRSSSNMVHLAENSLEKHRSLRSVVLIDHLIRFDDSSADPSSVKPYLARVANSEMKKTVRKFPIQ